MRAPLLHVFGLVLAALVASTTAWGHAALLGSDPADRAVVPRPPDAIRLTFNEPVSPLTLRLVGPDGSIRDLGGATSSNAVLHVPLPPGLANGTHLLSWRVISADGHPVGGALTFSIGDPSVQAPLRPQFETDWRLRVSIWLCRVMLYGGLFFGVGSVFYGAFVAQRAASSPVQRAVAVALQAGLIAAVLAVGLQGLDALDLPLSELRRTQAWLAGIGSPYGVTLSVAAASMIAALSALSRPVERRSLAAAAIVGVALALALSGHASSAEPQWLMRPAVFLHGLAVAFWVGALLPLAAAMSSSATRIDELRRFSAAIPFAVAVLVVSGLALAAVQVRQPEALLDTDYGRMLLVKLGIVAVLLAIGALNRYALTPRILAGDASAARRLSVTVKVDMILVAAILCVVAGWRFTPPPRAIQALAAQPVQVHIHTARAMADVQVMPARAGARAIVVALWDGNFAPLEAKELVVVLSKPDAGIEPIRAPAVHVGDTTWRVEGVTIPIRGRWRMRVEALINDFEKVAMEDEVELPY